MSFISSEHLRRAASTTDPNLLQQWKKTKPFANFSQTHENGVSIWHLAFLKDNSKLLDFLCNELDYEKDAVLMFLTIEVGGLTPVHYGVFGQAVDCFNVLYYSELRDAHQDFGDWTVCPHWYAASLYGQEAALTKSILGDPKNKGYVLLEETRPKIDAALCRALLLVAEAIGAVDFQAANISVADMIAEPKEIEAPSDPFELVPVQRLTPKATLALITPLLRKDIEHDPEFEPCFSLLKLVQRRAREQTYE